MTRCQGRIKASLQHLHAGLRRAPPQPRRGGGDVFEEDQDEVGERGRDHGVVRGVVVDEHGHGDPHLGGVAERGEKRAHHLQRPLRRLKERVHVELARRVAAKGGGVLGLAVDARQHERLANRMSVRESHE